MTEITSSRRRRAKTETARKEAARASATHLADLRRAHGKLQPDLSFPAGFAVRALVPRPGRFLARLPGQLCAEVAE